MFRHLNLKRKRLLTILRLLFRAYWLHYRKRPDEMYNLIGDELFKMGGVYIKFLQGVILQSWLMQRWRSDRKLDIFEKIDSPPLDAPAILAESLGEDAKQIKKLAKQPFAIGSFGHVYKAELNGRPIIVKILSPEISKTLRFDLRLLKFFWYFHLRSIRVAKGLNVKLVFDDFRNQTLREIDYVSEARFANQQYLTYRHHPQLVIPETFLKLCNRTLIVQEYIDGPPVTDLLRLKSRQPDVDLVAHVKKELGSDLIKQLKVLGYELLWGTFHHSQVMGDPHPGNVILLKNNRIALIDFGIAASSSQDPTAYLNLLKAYNALVRGKVDPQDIFSASLRFFGRDLYLALTKLSRLRSDGGRDINLNKELAKVVEHVFEETLGSKDLRSLTESPKALVVFNRLANKDNRFGFNLRIRDTEMLRTLVTWTSLVNLLDLYTVVMKDVYERVIRQVDRVYPDLQTMEEPEISHNQALTVVFSWLERIATHDPGLFKNLMSKFQIQSKDAPKKSETGEK